MKAVVAIVHGLGEHAGRYSEVASEMTDRGFQVWAFDQQGHGHDEGPRGVVSSYDQLLDEVGYLIHAAVTDWGKSSPRSQPVFLLGHSMGGNLAINYALRRKHRLQALIASSPMFLTQKEPKGLMNFLARAALKFFPDFCVSTGIRSQWLTDDPEEQKKVDKDPLYHRRVSLRLGSALIDSGRWSIENAHRLTVPCFITHGSQDRITMADGSAQFAQRAGSGCRFELLPGHQHEAFRDIDGRRVRDLWIEYLEAQCDVS